MSACNRSPCGLCVCVSCAHSIQILDPLLSDEMRRSPAWASWVALVELWSKVVQHALKAEDVDPGF